ncbi:enoyl-CoA hydratase/isomerase family protein [Skermanella rosea]|uniref:enoyl-CoA hydratase/isomerase family protein n=1 Tax=Skermanella rosea TaxID=1817965 RepID=UPI0019338BD8|nr:enoyl-CoA hydratase-related protein [Skermanella rosea]UEM03203.1 enoyl-CoA hydratase/isomerase family protein [Skermanella rosea]
MENLILTEHHGPVVTVTLNRPDKLNAFTKSMWQRLGEVMRRLSDDDSVRCIVLRGAGDRAFSPGNDISEFENERSNSEQASAYGKIIAGTLDAMRTCRHPTVALIKGICVGGGLEIAGSCDIRICGTSSRFGAPINKLGLVMGYAELDALIALAGRSTALEILLEGRIFGAAEAKDKGLVTRVVDDAEVDKEAMATARRISEGAPLVARWHKKFARRLAEGSPLSEAEMDEGYACYDTEDFRIGYRAFLDKVKPEFKGR